MKRKFLSVGFALLIAFTIVLSSCNGTTPSSTSSVSSEESSSVTSPYTIKITVIGSPTIVVSKTVQLRTTVTGTNQKDVTWSSKDESIAQVNENGLVTGVGAGTVAIVATLNIDENCTAEFKVTVEEAATPTSVTIIGYDTSVAWVNESIKLAVNVLPEEAASSVNWESNKSSVATIDETGLVTFLSEGDVVITATSTVDEEMLDYVEFSVQLGSFITNKGNGKWNVSNQSNITDAHIELAAEVSGGYNPVYYNHFQGQRFYIEATFQSLGNTANAWDWQGFGVGMGINDNDARFFSFSPHHPGQPNSHNKTILRDRPESWGALTTRSQVWGENDLNSIIATEQNKIALLRYDNFYYYLINDQVYWFDNTNKYENIDTYPFVFSYDIPLKVTDYQLISDESVLNDYLVSAEFNKSFFAAQPDNVNYTDDTDFTFLSSTTQSKDHKVRSLGDKAKLVGNFEIEFDVDNLKFNSEASSHTGIAVNLTRYDTADVVDTVSLGRTIEQDKGTSIIGRFARWDYPSSMSSPTAIKDWFETSAVVKEDALAKSHVKITRTIENDIAYFKLFVDGVEYDFDIGRNGAANGAYSTYTGAYLIWVSGEYSTSHISNFVFKSL